MPRPDGPNGPEAQPQEIAQREAALMEARQQVAMLTVIGLRDNLTPHERAAVKILERSARAEVKLRRKALLPDAEEQSATLRRGDLRGAK